METTAFDVQRCYVRIIRRKANQWVEFEFAVGEPELFVELLMPEEAFTQFCQEKRAELLPPRAESIVSDFDWNLHHVTEQRFR